MTYGQLLDAACACKTKEEADALVNARIEEVCVARHEMTVTDAREVVLHNIGYLSGYCDSETADRIYELFETSHPIVGRLHPSPDEALRAGMEMARKDKCQ